LEVAQVQPDRVTVMIEMATYIMGQVGETKKYSRNLKVMLEN
jgi:hypothetical protein